MANLSRPKRWAKAIEEANTCLGGLRQALDEINELRQEYEDWQSNLPENLQSGNLNDKLQTIVDLDVDSATSNIDDIESFISECEGAELPLGFGRD